MNDRIRNTLIVIVGPTAVGKTALCVRLAKQLSTEIISADSRQLYKEMSIGTAKPTPEEMQGVKHHFIDNKSILEDYNVGAFEKDVLAQLDKIFQEHSCCILTGGSGLYIDAVCSGIDPMPKIDPSIRETLNNEYKKDGLSNLVRELKQVDSAYSEIVDLNNPQRVIRALEVSRATGKPYSLFRKKNIKRRPFNILKVGLERDREELYERIDARMDNMIKEGLFDEAKLLYPFKAHNALQTVGYSEIFDFMDGIHDREEAVRLLKRNSRRYAKRQMTWFRRDESINWFHADNDTEILKFIYSKLN